MLADSNGDVLLLPATTRYESPGGGTETSTERRIIFSPEIPGRRIGSAKPEWWVFGEAMARAFPNRANYIRFDNAAEIRQEIARAIPLYKGIESLAAKGDQIQWGGRVLYADGGFGTADGKARLQGHACGAGHALHASRTGARFVSARRPAAASSSIRWSSARSIR